MEVAGLLQLVQHVQHRLPARALLGQLGDAQVGADVLQGLSQIPAAVSGQSIGLLQQYMSALDQTHSPRSHPQPWLRPSLGRTAWSRPCSELQLCRDALHAWQSRLPHIGSCRLTGPGVTA